MQDSVWLGAETQKITLQLAQMMQSSDGETPIIPIITEISVSPNSEAAPIRNIDVFNLHDALIERLRGGICHRRIALDQWIDFDRARGGDSGAAQVRLYMRCLLTAAELPLIDRTVAELAHDAGNYLCIGHGPGAVIDFRLPPNGRSPRRPSGRGAQIPRAGWRDLAPLIRMLRHAAIRVRPRWLVGNRTNPFRGMKPASLKPVQVESHLRDIERGIVAAPREAVLGLALVGGNSEPDGPRPRQAFSGAASLTSVD